MFIVFGALILFFSLLFWYADHHNNKMADRNTYENLDKYQHVRRTHKTNYLEHL
jgi:hypothetical protein